jgi:lysophospholipase L1-like esterase
MLLLKTRLTGTKRHGPVHAKDEQFISDSDRSMNYKDRALVRFPALIIFALLLNGSMAMAQKTNDLAETISAGTNAALAKMRWVLPTNAELEINGLPWFRQNGGELYRLPIRSKSTFRKPVWSLATCPSGGRIRFRTDSPTLAIRLEYSSAPNMANMQAFGQTGVDAYVNGAYMVTAIADKEAKPGKVYEIVLYDFSKAPRTEREVTLYLPLYKPVKVLGIGVEEHAKILKAKPFAVANPIVFYGTSITQGGCASRPGMSYQAILGRQLNVDFVNLGFSGNGLGEPELARAVCEIDASCYVLDFGANHKTFEAMTNVYAPFLDAVRHAHPTTPIVVMTPLYTSREKRMASLGLDWSARRKFIEGLVRERQKAGDQKLFVVDGANLLGTTPDDGLVDGGHPNDLGFYWMAQNLAPEFKKVLGRACTPVPIK